MERSKNKFFLFFCLGFAALTLACWLHSPRTESLTERRKLAQMPAFSWNALESGRFSTDFERYSQDQFPLREGFRSLKALFSTKLLRRSDNNRIYLSQGYCAELNYPADLRSARHAANRFSAVYDKYLSGSDRVFFSVIPDKSLFLEGNPRMDFDAFLRELQSGMPFARYLDLFPALTLDCYYRTDTHWRQEKLEPAARLLTQGMGLELRQTYTAREVMPDFLGVYAGQSALPMAGEPMYCVTAPAIENALVSDLENGKPMGVYNPDALTGRDPYEFYLSGPLSLITMNNPNAETQRRLILFRDSFGSSIAPYFLENYSEVTLVDIRYIPVDRLGTVVDFEDADVLFLYSTLVLNNSQTIK